MQRPRTILVDIDDTVVNTLRRRWMAWRYLGYSLPLDMVERHSSKEIIQLVGGDRDLWMDFWRLLLAFDEKGIELLKYDQPIPGVSETLLKLRAKGYKIVFITGRTKNMYDAVIQEFRDFNFPLDDIFMAEDLSEMLEKPLDVRRALLNKIMDKYLPLLAVDDYPKYHLVYWDFNIPHRIGYLRKMRFPSSKYKWSTFVADNWYTINSHINTLLG